MLEMSLCVILFVLEVVLGVFVIFVECFLGDELVVLVVGIIVLVENICFIVMEEVNDL